MGLLDDTRIDAALRNMRDTQQSLQRMQKAVGDLMVTKWAENRMMSVTVSGDGELKKIKFEGNRYRSAAPSELASDLVKLIGEAQDEAKSQVLSMYREYAPATMSEVFDMSGLEFDDMFDRAEQLAATESLTASRPATTEDGTP